MKSSFLRNATLVLLGLSLAAALLFIANSHSRLPEDSRLFYKSRTILIAAHYIDPDLSDSSTELNPYLKEFFEYVKDNLDPLSYRVVFLMTWVNYAAAGCILLALCQKLRPWILSLSLILTASLLLFDVLIFNNP